MGKFLKKAGKFLAFVMVTGIFVLIFGIYWQLSNSDTTDYQAVKQAINQYGDDLNEIREYFDFPVNNYDFLEADLTGVDNEGLEVEEDTQYQEGVKIFAEELAKKQLLLKNQEEAKILMDELIKDARFIKGLEKLELTRAKEIEIDDHYAHLKLLNNNKPLAQILFKLDTKQYGLQSIVGVQLIKEAKADKSAQAIVDFLEKNKDMIAEKKVLLEGQKNEMKALLENEQIREVLNKNTLTIKTDPIETAKAFEYYVTDPNGSPLLTISIDRETGVFKMDAKAYKTIQELEKPLFAKIQTLSGETDQIKSIKTQKANLEKYLVSPEFKTEMKAGGVEITPGREKESKINYELIYSDTQEKLGSIVFDNSTGHLTFVDATDGLESSLEDILSGSKKKP